jgi:hypothetical protein
MAPAGRVKRKNGSEAAVAISESSKGEAPNAFISHVAAVSWAATQTPEVMLANHSPAKTWFLSASQTEVFGFGSLAIHKVLRCPLSNAFQRADASLSLSELLIVIDSEQFNGWQQLHDSYVSGYTNPNAMGFIYPARIQIKLLKPDLALALTWWSMSFPSSKHKVIGNTTMNLQKFDDGWKVVASHSSTIEM